MNRGGARKRQKEMHSSDPTLQPERRVSVSNHRLVTQDEAKGRIIHRLLRIPTKVM